MSDNRRIRRASERKRNQAFGVLAELLGGFYEFLEQKKKPTDQKVRMEFQVRRSKWIEYCKRKQLPAQYIDEFTNNVKMVWDKHKRKKEKE